MTRRHEPFIIAPTGCVDDVVPQRPNPETSANVWTYATQHRGEMDILILICARRSGNGPHGLGVFPHLLRDLETRRNVTESSTDCGWSTLLP